MKTGATLLLFLCFGIDGAFSQSQQLLSCGGITYIPDEKFSWANNDCTGSHIEKVYAKVELDPQITSFDKNEFELFIRQLFEELNFPETVNGTIKLKLLFAIHQPLCVSKIGEINTQLSSEQQELIVERFQNSITFNAGRQRNEAVHCERILYLTIGNGKVAATERKNFRLKNENLY